MDGSDILIRAVCFARYMYVLVLLHVCNDFIAYINREKVVDASRRTIYKDFSFTPWQKCKLKIERWKLRVENQPIAYIYMYNNPHSYPLGNPLAKRGIPLGMWIENWKLKNMKDMGWWFPLPRGDRWGWQHYYMVKDSNLSAVSPCQCQGVNANHYIAEFLIPIGRYCCLGFVLTGVWSLLN